MRVVIISDAHLFQTYIRERYDSIRDFSIVLKEIKGKMKPDILLIAGDIFDYKKTSTTYLRHYEGEALMIKIRSILKKFNIPIYAIRGNHEKEEVLRGLEQTVDNFHYIKNDWKRLGDILIYFMDTHYEPGLYDRDAVSSIFKEIISQAKEKNENMKILLSHESFHPFSDSLPKDVIEKARKAFNWIFNGHMHLWNPSAYGFSNVITLPSLLPSRVVLGRYWMERYSWNIYDKKFSLEKRESPFGYVMLDTEEGSIRFNRFNPSKTIVEVTVETTGLTLQEVRKRFEEILMDIEERGDKNKLIILPEIHGEASFITSFVKDVFKEHPDLNIEEMRDNATFKIRIAGKKEISAPILKTETLLDEMIKRASEIQKSIEEELELHIEERRLREIITNIFKDEILKRPKQRVTSRLEALLDLIISVLRKNERPEGFEDNFKSIIKRVKE